MTAVTKLRLSERYAQKAAFMLAPLGRIFIALIFVMSGMNKISQYSATQAYMDMMGVPGFLLPLVIALEVVAGIFIIIGYQVRISALLLAGFTVLSALMFHADFSDQLQMISFMKNIAIAGGFLMLVVHGGGAMSLDNRQQA
ncbi:DoxX family protein [Thalassotalea profundi]|uniref:Membrane protein n=1 Tax=Thalassotalea profundi TaxID=2036687 RepID=A0ABQ3IXP7_9GAMM|nr:DoxX family protein [Thalassotalea profundi]GHE97656.1 membrane protein [Thalassotalea profundi]